MITSPLTVRENLKFIFYFIGLCIIWGLTWIPIKIGLELIPSNFFAAVRFILAGLVLLIFCWKNNECIKIKSNTVLRLVFVSFLMNAGTYGLLYFGVAHLNSGLVALLNMTLIPIFFLIIDFFIKVEKVSIAKILGVFLGVVGLSLLFSFDANQKIDTPLILGIVATILSSLFYCIGSIISRPLFNFYSPVFISGFILFFGGLLLLVYSLIFEPINLEILRLFLKPSVFLSLFYLITFGSIVGFTIYMKLLQVWEPVKAGMYCFISPIIAVNVGILFLGEKFEISDFMGMALMLGATAITLFSKEGQIISKTPVKQGMDVEKSITRAVTPQGDCFRELKLKNRN